MKVLTGGESLIFEGKSLNRPLIEFWRWTSSNLLNNTLRGVFAEFIVATALDIDLTDVRSDWASFDLKDKDGLRIEVKSSAYLQSWFSADQPNKRSKIIFSISPALEWSDNECKYRDNSYERHSDVYVFCHYTCMDRTPESPLNLDHWDFYVLATAMINERFGSQKTVSLTTLRTCCQPVKFGNLKDTIQTAVKS